MHVSPQKHKGTKSALNLVRIWCFSAFVASSRRVRTLHEKLLENCTPITLPVEDQGWGAVAICPHVKALKCWFQVAPHSRLGLKGQYILARGIAPCIMVKAACGLKGHHNTSSNMLPFQGAGYGCAPLQGALPPAKIGWPFRPFVSSAEGDKSQLRPLKEL